MSAGRSSQVTNVLRIHWFCKIEVQVAIDTELVPDNLVDVALELTLERVDAKVEVVRDTTVERHELTHHVAGRSHRPQESILSVRQCSP